MKALLEKLQTWEETATKREKFLIVFIFILVPLFLFYQFYYVQAKEKINILREDVKKLDIEIKKYENLVKKIKVLKVQMKQRREFLNRVKNILPSGKEIPDILRQISDLAKENNLEIITFEPGGEKPQDYYNIIPLKMKIEGRFRNIVSFLNSIESLPRLVVLNDIKFQVINNQLSAITTFYTFKYTGVPLEKKKTKKGRKR